MIRGRIWVIGLLILACGPEVHNWESMSKTQLLQLPNNDTAHIYLGRMALDSGQVQLAKQEFQKALNVNPDNPVAHYELGRWFHAQKQLDSAEVHYRKALSLDSSMADPRLKLGDILVRRKQRDSALAQWDTVLQMHPDDPKLWFEVGFLLEKILRFDDAAEHYKKAGQLDSTWAKPKEQLADMYFRLAKADEAISAIRDFLELQPHNIKHRLRLGQMLLFKGDTAAAQQEFQRVLQEDSTCVEAHASMGFLLMGKGYRGPAKKHFLAAARLVREQGGDQEQAQLFEELAEEMDKPSSTPSSAGAIILKPTPKKPKDDGGQQE